MKKLILAAAFLSFANVTVLLGTVTLGAAAIAVACCTQAIELRDEAPPQFDPPAKKALPLRERPSTEGLEPRFGERKEAPPMEGNPGWEARAAADVQRLMDEVDALEARRDAHLLDGARVVPVAAPGTSKGAPRGPAHQGDEPAKTRAALRAEMDALEARLQGDVKEARASSSKAVGRALDAVEGVRLQARADNARLGEELDRARLDAAKASWRLNQLSRATAEERSAIVFGLLALSSLWAMRRAFRLVRWSYRRLIVAAVTA